MGYRALIGSGIPRRAALKGDALQASLRHLVDSSLGYYKIHGNVMRLGINIVEPQHFERYSYCQRTWACPGQGAIEITPSISKAEAQLIEANHRYDACANRDQIGLVWNRDAICSRCHRGARPPLSEAQRFMPAHDFWKRKRCPPLMKEFHVWTGIVLAAMRPAKPDRASLQYRKASHE